MSMLLAESHKGSGSKSTASRSQGGKVPKCNLEEFAGFWQAIDVDDASNLRASIKCFKDGETQVKQTIIFCSYHIYHIITLYAHMTCSFVCLLLQSAHATSYSATMMPPQSAAAVHTFLNKIIPMIRPVMH